MGFFTYDTGVNVSAKLADYPDSCEHVFQGALALGGYTEHDSFGPVAKGFDCKECVEKRTKEDFLECEWCHVRNESVGTKKSSDSSDWYCICSACDEKQYCKKCGDMAHHGACIPTYEED